MSLITSLKLKFGSSEGQEGLEFVPTPVTIFVGPNNSGKSKVISEILGKCKWSRSDSSDVILKQIMFREFSSEEAEKIIEEQDGKPFQSDNRYRYEAQNFSPLHWAECAGSDLLNAFNTGNNWGLFSQYYLKPIFLGGENRLSLLKSQKRGDLLAFPITIFQKLFRENDLREEYRHKIYDALAIYPLLDSSQGDLINMRISSREPSQGIERSLEKDALEFQRQGSLIDTASDGVKAYAGLLAEIMAGDPRILLMDEPEAFLYPPLAQKMGKEVAQLLKDQGKYLFTATHSPYFIMGCIQAGVPINIVRLTYKKGEATARLLKSEKLKELMYDPLLRSANVISALFYENVIVTEGDSDRAFYQEINERLLAEERGIANTLFLNAQNKQTIPKLIKPLRDLGIPVAGIYDLDILKDGGREATRHMAAGYIPDILYGGFGTTRSRLDDKLKEQKAYQQGGIDSLSQVDRQAAEKFIKDYAEYGLFIVPKGVLESWLKDLGVEKRKSDWLIAIFERMGSDPNDPAYVKPARDDVWLFMENIKKWFEDPLRKGLPE